MWAGFCSRVVIGSVGVGRKVSPETFSLVAFIRIQLWRLTDSFLEEKGMPGGRISEVALSYVEKGLFQSQAIFMYSVFLLKQTPNDRNQGKAKTVNRMSTGKNGGSGLSVPVSNFTKFEFHKLRENSRLSGESKHPILWILVFDYLPLMMSLFKMWNLIWRKFKFGSFEKKIGGSFPSCVCIPRTPGSILSNWGSWDVWLPN